MADQDHGSARQVSTGVDVLDVDRMLSLREYQNLARQSPNLTHGEYRCLDALMSFADWGGQYPGGNCFPSHKQVASRAGGGDLPAVKRFLRSLRDKGWVRSHRMRRNVGGRQASNLYQFCLPPGEVPGDEFGWKGPVAFEHRGESAHLRLVS